MCIMLRFLRISIVHVDLASVACPPSLPAAATAGGSLRLVEVALEGLLQSDVSCCSCGHTSSAYDPYR